jgi:hypothetical protein
LALSLQDEKHTVATLSTTLVLLDQSNGVMDVVQLHHQRLSDDLLNGSKRLMLVHDRLVYLPKHFLPLLWLLFGLIIVISGLLLLLFLLLALLLLFLLTADLLYWLFELNVERDLVELLEVPRHRYLNDRWVVLQIEKKLIEMNIHACWARVEEYQVFLNLADAAYSRFEDLLDIYTLLRMNHLVIAFLELSVDVNVLDV